AGVTINRCPYRITRDISWISKEQEGATNQCRVEEVFAGTAKHFFTNHYTKADTKRRLPQWQVRRTDQCKQDRSDEETFVYLMSAHHRKPRRPNTANDEYRCVNREEVGRTYNEVIPNAL